MNWEKLSFKVYMKPIFFAYFPSLVYIIKKLMITRKCQKVKNYLVFICGRNTVNFPLKGFLETGDENCVRDVTV